MSTSHAEGQKASFDRFQTQICFFPQEMRQKVKHMMLLLDERRNKLMATVDVLQKKSGVVEKVNKLLDSKERRANYVEKQRDECLAFDKKPKKN